jgi:polyisoprenoid-binding protein YceI
MSETTTIPAVATGTYNIDPTHTRIGFVARHAMVSKVRGNFGEFTGSGHFNADDPNQSTLELTIQATSINTGNADRDNHLRSNDFFAMETYPEIRFVSTKVEKVDDENYKVTGDLTIKDVTKPVTIAFELSGPVQDPWGNTRIGLEGKGEINRKDFGVNFNAALETGGLLVSDKINLEFDVEAVKA